MLSVSTTLGFPYADVYEMGSAFVVVTDGDERLAQECADELGHYLWRHRQSFLAELINIDSALDIAAEHDGPVLLLDMGENIGGGSPGDGTLLAHALLKRNLSTFGFVCIADRQSVQQAFQAGKDAHIAMCIGGKHDTQHGPPIETRVTVLGLYDGRFEEPAVRHSAFTRYDMGPTAVVRTDEGLTIMLTTAATMPFSLRQLTCCGLDPKSFKVIIAKGVHAPVAAYSEVCNKWIRVNTPGVTSVDMESFTFKNRRRPMFPFELDTEWPQQGARKLPQVL